MAVIYNGVLRNMSEEKVLDISDLIGTIIMFEGEKYEITREKILQIIRRIT